MPSWVIKIRGHGPHHNGRPEDADQMFAQLFEEMGAFGHSFEAATMEVENGVTVDLLDPRNFRGLTPDPITKAAIMPDTENALDVAALPDADLVEALIEHAGDVVGEEEKGTMRGADESRRLRNLCREEIVKRLGRSHL